MNTTKAKEKNRFMAVVSYDGECWKAVATKSFGTWLIGGDFLRSLPKGATVMIVSKGKLYSLKGNRMIFQDYAGENEFWNSQKYFDELDSENK